VKVSRQFISAHSTKTRWHHQHLNSCDIAFQNGDQLQVMTDLRGQEDTINGQNSFVQAIQAKQINQC